MKKRALHLLAALGIKNYTERHLKIIDDFVLFGNNEPEKLLDLLGSWDEQDLIITKNWLALDGEYEPISS